MNKKLDKLFDDYAKEISKEYPLSFGEMLKTESALDKLVRANSKEMKYIKQNDNLFNVKLVFGGKVQGVGFRWFVQEIADIFYLKGWVRNKSTNEVEVEVDGCKEELDKFIKICSIGPKFSEVSYVKQEWKQINQSEFFMFKIKDSI